MTPEQMEKAYREWWADSYPCPPNLQAVLSAVAWGQHLQDLLNQQKPNKDS